MRQIWLRSLRVSPFRNLSRLSLWTRAGLGTPRYQLAVTVLLGNAGAVLAARRGAPGRAHGSLLSLRVCLERVLAGSRPTGGTSVSLKVSTSEARLRAALRSRSMNRPQYSQR